MKFYKTNWERKGPVITLSENALYELVSPAFPNQKIESHTTLSEGLANTNIRFKLEGLNDWFMIRIYTRDIHAIHQEVALAEKLGDELPMPEFMHVDKESMKFPYAIQRWVEAKPLYEILQTGSPEHIQMVAKEVAKALCTISSHRFPKPGFFKENLDIIPFENVELEHPFVTYVKECLFEQYAGQWLGAALTELTWKYILDNQSYFPALSPSCLVQGDFNPDNILINEKTGKIAAILDWEFAFSGSYLFDIGNLLRFEIPSVFENTFIQSYEAEQNLKLPMEWQKMIKVQDLTNLVGLINTPTECPNRIRDIQGLIEETLAKYP